MKQWLPLRPGKVTMVTLQCKDMQDMVTHCMGQGKLRLYSIWKYTCNSLTSKQKVIVYIYFIPCFFYLFIFLCHSEGDNANDCKVHSSLFSTIINIKIAIAKTGKSWRKFLCSKLLLQKCSMFSGCTLTSCQVTSYHYSEENNESANFHS